MYISGSTRLCDNYGVVGVPIVLWTYKYNIKILQSDRNYLNKQPKLDMHNFND
jgi:hypothetical protein